MRVRHHRILLTLKGTVIRSGAIKMYEGERLYMCEKCQHRWGFVFFECSFALGYAHTYAKLPFLVFSMANDRL